MMILEGPMRASLAAAARSGNGNLPSTQRNGSTGISNQAMERRSNPVRWLFASDQGPRTVMLARWLWLRALAAIYFSAFFSLLFQVRGLIGEHGILPAGQTLSALAEATGKNRYWIAPSLFWISSSTHFILAVMWIGLLAS